METESSAPEQLGLLIKETQSVLHSRMDDALRPLGLSVPQYACLQWLQNLPGITASELARRVFVSRQSMNVLLQGLDKRGLVERADEPGPRRERGTMLTRAGDDAIGAAHEAVVGVADALVLGLSAADQSRLLTLLGICRDNLLADGA
ncbi:MarR family winged helix-turn-helix transcriptional regulator [Microbacterium sp. RD1]|uniref:MarR family winged helix-turn-helix transcriptional regulator n=1 Tax=Microbacterium sp. RD1 TaxID=3457313 RepID=UPI003FA5C0DB